MWGLWRLNRDKGSQRLIILAAAFVKLQENNLRAFTELIMRAKDLIISDNILISKEKLFKKINIALKIHKSFKIESSDIKLQ